MTSFDKVAPLNDKIVKNHTDITNLQMLLDNGLIKAVVIEFNENLETAIKVVYEGSNIAESFKYNEQPERDATLGMIQDGINRFNDVLRADIEARNSLAVDAGIDVDSFEVQ